MLARSLAIVIAALVIAPLVGCDSNPVSSAEYKYSESEEFNFSTSDSVLVVADTFVGLVIFAQGASDGVHVTVTKRADLEGDLDRLLVETSQPAGEVHLSASNPEDLDDVAVDIEIVGPLEALLDLAAGVGSVDCVGRPSASWVADVGVGSVAFKVPADVNVSVELLTGVGHVDVEFDVAGEVSARRVVGIIGSGDEGDLVAHVGVGDVSLIRQ